MSTDLELEIRDALHARARSVTVDSLSFPSAPRAQRANARTTWTLLTAAVTVVAVAVLLVIAPWDTDVGTGPAPASGSAGVPAAGTAWRLIRAYTPDGTVVAAGSIPARLEFTRGGELLINDGLHSIDTTYLAIAHGFQVNMIGATGNGYAGNDRRVLAVLDSMEAVYSDADGGPVRIESHLRGTRLTLLVSGYILQFRRQG